MAKTSKVIVDPSEKLANCWSWFTSLKDELGILCMESFEGFKDMDWEWFNEPVTREVFMERLSKSTFRIIGGTQPTNVFPERVNIVPPPKINKRPAPVTFTIENETIDSGRPSGIRISGLSDSKSTRLTEKDLDKTSKKKKGSVNSTGLFD